MQLAPWRAAQRRRTLIIGNTNTNTSNTNTNINPSKYLDPQFISVASLKKQSDILYLFIQDAQR